MSSVELSAAELQLLLDAMRHSYAALADSSHSLIWDPLVSKLHQALWPDEDAASDDLTDA